ncbi:MAG: hypothetical protein BV459_02335 [Thermoplasmata archaeon M11B2D]|nr:MAG: hypothetical protein BV459_02335 [Thermoplasmata archaeon M11B2D]PNX53869.1 MAG: hypothetical protein BV458_02150 [Thermoplasmata archaeon M9B2D]
MCLSSISLSDPTIEKNTAKTEVIIHTLNQTTHCFTLLNKYPDRLSQQHIALLRLAFCMPLLNYGLFSKKIQLDFPVSKADFQLLTDFNLIFSREIFVNKIARGTNPYILEEFLPDPETILPHDGDPTAMIKPTQITADTSISTRLNPLKSGVLSSGGKDSLLTYGLLTELGSTVYPLYMNESGGHWKTALTAYRYHKKTDPNTQRVWTNVDRFYGFMLDHLRIIRPDHRKKWDDTYPIRLCIFPFYVFSVLPIFINQGISHLLLGSEFDDFRSAIQYKGIPHYYGLYDQHQDFDLRMNHWYRTRIPGLSQWSALRNISGLVGQHILVSRYPALAKQQRSCHSCHIKNSIVYPCGQCLKCLGILLYLLAKGTDPTLMKYQRKHIDLFYKNIGAASLSLDQDEKNHSFFLLKQKGSVPKSSCVDHVEKIHVHPSTCDPGLYPASFRMGLLRILEQYTSGYCTLRNGVWVQTEQWQEHPVTVAP